MKLRRMAVLIASLLAAALSAAFLVPSSLAYLWDQTDPVVNTFAPPAGLHEKTTAEIHISKQVISQGNDTISPEGFTFILENAQSGEQLSAVSNAKGEAAFSLSFTGADAGKRFCYSLYELNDQRKNITYSNTVYDVQIQVDFVDHRPLATVYLNGRETARCQAAFENLYTPVIEPPFTGDSTPEALYALLLLASSGVLWALKKRAKP